MGAAERSLGCLARAASSILEPRAAASSSTSARPSGGEHRTLGCTPARIGTSRHPARRAACAPPISTVQSVVSRVHRGAWTRSTRSRREPGTTAHCVGAHVRIAPGQRDDQRTRYVRRLSYRVSRCMTCPMVSSVGDRLTGRSHRGPSPNECLCPSSRVGHHLMTATIDSHS